MTSSESTLPSQTFRLAAIFRRLLQEESFSIRKDAQVGFQEADLRPDGGQDGSGHDRYVFVSLRMRA